MPLGILRVCWIGGLPALCWIGGLPLYGRSCQYAGLAACRFMAIGIVRVWWIGGLSLCAGLAACRFMAALAACGGRGGRAERITGKSDEFHLA